MTRFYFTDLFMDVNHFYTIEKPAAAEFRDRGSKFIAYAYPLKDIPAFKEKLAALKKEHPKAVHHCFAYRLGFTGDQFRASDDGEPSGSAGKPILGQIDSKELTQVLIIVVRYFGGTLLGVPGLIHAYKTAAALALENSQVIEKPVLVFFSLQFDYTRMNEVMRVVKHYDCEIIRQDMQLFCVLDIAVAKLKADEVELKLKDMQGVESELITDN